MKMTSAWWRILVKLVGGRTHFVAVSPFLDATRGESLASCSVMCIAASTDTDAIYGGICLLCMC